MKEYYEKELNRQIDIVRGIDSVCFSIGANNREDFAWIAHNIDLFKRKSIEVYNSIVSSIIEKTSVISGNIGDIKHVVLIPAS